LAVIGHPIGHSVSPQMHNAALAELAASDARFEGWRYSALDVEPENLPAALDMLHARGFVGVNLTVPHKVLAVGLVTGVDRDGADAGAVNTLHRHGSGWRGFNTDGYGLEMGVGEDLGAELRGTPVVLLGAGGAARGAAAQCLRSGCSELWVVNRSSATLDALLAQIAPIAGDVPVRGIHGRGQGAGVPAGALVINATSAGLRPGEPAPVDLAHFPGVRAVYDMIYNPAVTPLLAQARSLGIPCANGVSMLVHQGAKALEIWTGVPASRLAPVMRAAAAKALGS
jgi:shikimate dehydrogenase